MQPHKVHAFVIEALPATTRRAFADTLQVKLSKQLRQVLGITEVNFVAGKHHLAVVDSALEGKGS